MTLTLFPVEVKIGKNIKVTSLDWKDEESNIIMREYAKYKRIKIFIKYIDIEKDLPQIIYFCILEGFDLRVNHV